jgi:hypothetical protein
MTAEIVSLVCLPCNKLEKFGSKPAYLHTPHRCVGQFRFFGPPRQVWECVECGARRVYGFAAQNDPQVETIHDWSYLPPADDTRFGYGLRMSQRSGLRLTKPLKHGA